MDAAGVAAPVIGAAVVSAAARRLYMALPAHWLCEFDEAACELHMPGMRGAGGAPGRACKAFVVFMAAFYVFAVAGGSLWGGAAVVFLAAAAFSDMDYMIIPDQLLWAAAACALAGACARGCGLAGAAMGAITGGGLMFISTALSSVFYGPGAIGAGDIKMMFVCGALAGSPEKAVIMFAAAVMSSALFISAGIIIRRLHSGSFVPMAPFIALAAVMFM